MEHDKVWNKVDMSVSASDEIQEYKDEEAVAGIDKNRGPRCYVKNINTMRPRKHTIIDSWSFK